MPDSGRLDGLTIGTPECGARIQALFARFNWCAAFATWFIAPAVHPKILFPGDTPGRSSQARERDDRVAGTVRNTGEQEFSSGGQQT